MEEGREKFDAFVKEYSGLPIKTVDDDKLAGTILCPRNGSQHY